MTADDRRRWDERHRRRPVTAVPTPPPHLVEVADLLPAEGRALDLACGSGAGTVWLAERGLTVDAIDISEEAIGRARAAAEAAGVGPRCRFLVADLDDGLPPGPPVDLVVCHLFRDARLDRAVIDRLVDGGVVMVVALSEVGGPSGRFRVAEGELAAAFSELEILDHHEGGGVARIVARRHWTTSDDPA